MNEHPILFSTPMVKAILEDWKTKTRRVIKPQPSPTALLEAYGAYACFTDGTRARCPYGPGLHAQGDRLWVRETWAQMCKNADPICQCTEDYEYRENHYIEYRADTGNPYPGQWPIDEARGNPDAPKWCPSIHMPRKASRITLEVVNVRVERLQDITEEDAKAEGVNFVSCDPGEHPVDLFANLWDSINEKRGFGWDTNPLVWVVEFKRLP
jgi:hypothetical protein